MLMLWIRWVHSRPVMGRCLPALDLLADRSAKVGNILVTTGDDWPWWLISWWLTVTVVTCPSDDWQWWHWHGESPLVTNGGEASHKNHKRHPNFPSVQFKPWLQELENGLLKFCDIDQVAGLGQIGDHYASTRSSNSSLVFDDSPTGKYSCLTWPLEYM